jgi:hypothetical protein
MKMPEESAIHDQHAPVQEPTSGKCVMIRRHAGMENDSRRKSGRAAQWQETRSIRFRILELHPLST